MGEATVREASCSCGGLKLRLTGEPQMVSSCACQAFQRRTGAPLSVNAFYGQEQVADRQGEAREFERVGASGKPLTFRFCPACGSTVWWEAGSRPGLVAVAAGAFADRDFPPPQRLVWAVHAAPWIRPPEGVPIYPEAP